MKIVHVIHGFPPYNMAGSEVYTYNLTRELAKKDEVYIFHRIADTDREEYEIGYNEFDGIKIRTINNTFKNCSSFEQTYKNNIISEKFGAFLDEITPHVVHFGHVTCLSTTLVEEAKKRGVPTIFTLHDFWLFCQLGQLLKRDLSLCSGPQDSECARCLAPQLIVKGGINKAVNIMKKSIPKLHDGTRIGRFLRAIHLQYAKVFFLFQNEAHIQIQERTAHINQICSQVDLFIAPSKFLLEKFVEFGISRDRIMHLDYGFDTTIMDNLATKSSKKIRFGYIGTFIPSKGVHVLLEAFNILNSPDAELRIYGKFLPYHSGFEDYPDYLKTLGKSDTIFWMGEYDNKDIASILSEIDVLVVPSIWYENSPLTIHEAFMANLPVITSNIGGMAELVHNGENGLLFKVGNSNDLCEKLQIIIKNPDLIEKWKRNIQQVIPIEEHASIIRGQYEILHQRIVDFFTAKKKLLASDNLTNDEKDMIRKVSPRLHPKDQMYVHSAARSYLTDGLSAVRCINDALNKTQRNNDVQNILDFPSGHGRVLRFLKVRFPYAKITACEIDPAALEFCKDTFSVKAILSDTDFSKLSLFDEFDLIWCGSLITHIDENTAINLLTLFYNHLSPNGLCLFSTHGELPAQWIEEKENTYGLTESAQQKILMEFRESGYGYAGYGNVEGYGISLVSRDRMLAIARGVGQWDEIFYRKQGWANHHDVYGFLKIS